MTMQFNSDKMDAVRCNSMLSGIKEAISEYLDYGENAPKYKISVIIDISDVEERNSESTTVIKNFNKNYEQIVDG